MRFANLDRSETQTPTVGSHQESQSPGRHPADLQSAHGESDIQNLKSDTCALQQPRQIDGPAPFASPQLDSIAALQAAENGLGPGARLGPTCSDAQ